MRRSEGSTIRTASDLDRSHGSAIDVLRWVFPREHRPPTTLGPRVVLGRDADCTVSLDGEDVSRRHAEITTTHGRWRVRDLGSKNGVFVNGVQVTESALAPADVVRVGRHVGIVQQTESVADTWFEEMLPGVLGGPALRRALRSVPRAAQSALPIVVEGETGTGKERVAHAIHVLSGRSGRYIALNCAAVPESLAEATLFGHAAGSFTGATKASPGFFRSAHLGTLLLDEIGDLAPSLQPKLLRALEEREVASVGEVRPTEVDVRVISASQVPLHDLVAENRFRPDLFARLDELTVRLPPLRERVEDIPMLFLHHLEQLGATTSLDVRVVERLCLYDWPGNIRELVQLARRIATLHEAPTIRPEDLPDRMLGRQPGRGAGDVGAEGEEDAKKPPAREPLPPRDQAALETFIEALKSEHGNLTRACERLGISRARAYRLMDGQSIDLRAIRRAATTSPRSPRSERSS